MGRRKQIFILVCLLLLRTVCGWCIEDSFSQKFSNDIGSRLERLQIYFETEMYEEASTLLNELISEFPDEPRLKYLRAIVDYQRQDYERASVVFVEFIEKYPQEPEPYYLLGEINLKKDNKGMARKYFKKYCELVPQDIDAHQKLNSISNNIGSDDTLIIKDGEEDKRIVEKIGFYGACVHSRKSQSIKLINGSFCTWSSMGIDFVYPIDLRGKKITIKLKGKKGGERLELTFRDKFAKDYNPQLVLAPEGEVLPNWQQIKVTLGEHQPKIDLSSVVHMGLEFGFSTVQNPAHSTLFVKDIVIEVSENTLNKLETSNYTDF